MPLNFFSTHHVLGWKRVDLEGNLVGQLFFLTGHKLKNEFSADTVKKKYNVLFSN